MVLEHGCPPFFFDWGGGTAIADTVPALLLLPVGTHSITVTDGRMEGDTISVTIVPAPAITATTATDVACPIGADPSIGGTASIQAIGGTGAFSFLWSNGDSTATVRPASGRLPSHHHRRRTQTVKKFPKLDLNHKPASCSSA